MASKLNFWRLSHFDWLFLEDFSSNSLQCCEQINILVVHLTHWGRVTYICVGKLTIIGSDNGLSPGRRQAIIWTNAGILSIEPLGTNFSEILIRIQIFSLKKMRLKMLSAKWRPFWLGLNVLKSYLYYQAPFSWLPSPWQPLCPGNVQGQL